jgi:hypothetical protein
MSIKKQPGLVYELSTVLQARTPDDLSPQKQAILAYANLKMQSNDFSSYLQGKQAASDVYGKVWVTKVAHIRREIKTNWQNAIKRSVNQKSNHAFFGLALYPLYQVYPTYFMTADFRSESNRRRL